MEQQKTYEAQIGRQISQEELREWLDKRGLTVDEDGKFTGMPYKGEEPPTEREQILENVRINSLRHDVPNLHPREHTNRTMVYVGGGPTCAQFLDEIKRKSLDPQYDVITSNKTCKWLLANGIKPTYHLILDPQQKKLKDLDYPEGVNLILGIQCHPDLFERAKEKGVHVEKFLASSVVDVDGQLNDKQIAMSALHAADRQLLGIGGGSMCGTRMIYFAAGRGYKRLEYYGFDGSISYENNVIRCYSYNKMRGENVIETECEDGRKFFTTMSLGRQAEELVKLYNEYPGLDIEIYGDSLLSHTLYLYNKLIRKEADYRFTPEYGEMMREYHKSPSFGVVGSNSAPMIFLASAQIAKANPSGKCVVLDYGCGKGKLVKAIHRAFPKVKGVDYCEYDPFIPGKDAEPKKADLVFCGDVMEHVEPECVNAVFKHVASLARHLAVFVITLIPAKKILPDGRNAHICLRGHDWWLSYIRRHFNVVEKQINGETLTVSCKPR